MDVPHPTCQLDRRSRSRLRLREAAQHLELRQAGRRPCELRGLLEARECLERRRCGRNRLLEAPDEPERSREPAERLGKKGAVAGDQSLVTGA